MNTPESLLNRNYAEDRIKSTAQWEVVIIGGGATGLGIALDSAARGYRTLLLEQHDFAKGTSSRSTKLVHGGVRYLAQGNLRLVRDALRERWLLLKNAPHLVKKQAFIIPCYSWFQVLKYLIGLKFYDLMAGKHSFGKSVYCSKTQVVADIPGINTKGLKGGIQYYDGRFDDARLAISIARTATEKGAVLLNYARVTGLIKTQGKISGLKALNMETDEVYTISSTVVVNATGVYVDEILKLDLMQQPHLVRPSQGVHVVLPRSFLSGEKALMIPKTSDGRVLFGVPWHNLVLLGTTDTPVEQTLLEPQALEKEIDFILNTAGFYLTAPPEKKDVLSIFAGLRPLAAVNKSSGSKTKEISRDHKLVVSGSGLITITGGKWTTYRKMAEETVDKAIKTGNLRPALCTTKSISIHGYTEEVSISQLSVYGSEEAWIKHEMTHDPALAERLDVEYPYIKLEVILAVRLEMARTVEDVLARRLRILFLDAKAAMRMAPVVAAIMASELFKDEEWENEQVQTFLKLAENYICNH